MGALVNNVCYSSSGDAANAYFSALPSSVVSGSTTYESHYSVSGGVWYLVTDTYNASMALLSSVSAVAEVPAFAACDPSQSFYDGMTLGWGVVAAMCAAWAIRVWRLGL